MGGMNSCLIPHHQHDDPRVKGRKSKFKSSRRNLSATFNLSVVEDSECVQSFVNINTATEEELMTLPGINRAIAKNIVDYRRQIGGYRRVEDLALVSGVGADKLGRIRCDVCIAVKSPASGSRDSSIRGSRLLGEGEGVKGERNGRGGVSTPQPLVVNVNKANMYQLNKIKGMGLQLAENIVTYREKNGPFKSLDDLVKVKGVSYGILSAIRPYLSLDSSNDLSPSTPLPETPTQVANGHVRRMNSKTSLPTLELEPQRLSKYQRRSMNSTENLLQALGPLAEVPKRPTVAEPFSFQRSKRRVVRVASWNLQQCSLDKVSNPGVKDVICMTILENGFGIIAIQELLHDKALEEICNELNEPTLPNVKRWRGQIGRWRCEVSPVSQGSTSVSVEYSGFLYDASQDIELLSANVLDMGKDNGIHHLPRLPYVALFTVDGQLDWAVVSLHLGTTPLDVDVVDCSKKENAPLSSLLSALCRHVPGDKEVLLVGDFSVESQTDWPSHLKKKGYMSVVEESCSTTISTSKSEGCNFYDNIWINGQAQKLYTGMKGVVREGLSSPWIPDGWRWGGVVSHHCPVYAEFFTARHLDNAESSVAPDNIRFIIGADSG